MQTDEARTTQLRASPVDTGSDAGLPTTAGPGPVDLVPKLGGGGGGLGGLLGG